jgi:hypothetical protein
MNLMLISFIILAGLLFLVWGAAGSLLGQLRLGRSERYLSAGLALTLFAVALLIFVLGWPDGANDPAARQTEQSAPATLTASPAPAGSNLLINPNFDSRQTGWSVNPAAADALTINPGPSGPAACATQNLLPNQPAAWAGVWQRTPAQAGQRYLFSGLFKAEKAVNFQVRAQWYDAQGSPLGEPAILIAPTGQPPNGWTTTDWTTLQSTASAPPDSATVELFILHGIDPDGRNLPGGVVCFDDLRLAALSAVRP